MTVGCCLWCKSPSAPWRPGWRSGACNSRCARAAGEDGLWHRSMPSNNVYGLFPGPYALRVHGLPKTLAILMFTQVDWAGCVTSVANQSGDVVSRMPSTSGRTSAAAAASLSKHGTQGSAPGGTDACTGSSAGSAAGAGAASASAAGIRAAAAGSGAQTHLFGLPPEGFIGCNLFKLIPELGALAPDEDLQDDILEELRLM